MRIETTLTIERLKEVIDYDALTGVFTWKTSRKNVRAGDRAGTVDPTKSGYRYIRLDQKDYLAQRLAWFYVNGVWPEHILRFKDQNRDNCAIANLYDTVALTPGAKFNHRTPEGRSAYGKAHRAANPRRYRDRELKKTFGIDLAEYQRMFVEQKGVCAACAKPETATRNGKVKWLAVDHNHTTGEVRGLLCSACNVALGLLGDSMEGIMGLAAYYQRHAPKTDAANVVSLKKESA